jgi:hypothetical protein
LCANVPEATLVVRSHVRVSLSGVAGRGSSKWVILLSMALWSIPTLLRLFLSLFLM